MQIFDPLSPKPFVKWVGGKRRSLPVLLSYVPDVVDTYVEPFVGGGAMLFAMRFKRAIINDSNEELICAYKAVRDDLEGLKKLLKTFRYDKEMFTEIRAWDREKDFVKRPIVERGARLIYLIKTGFNGLYRVNRRNYFNVPFGRLSNPNICDEPVLEACHRFLNEKEVEICCTDYSRLKDVIPNDAFVYLDPPYAPLNKTSSFTSYQLAVWTDRDQERLRDFCVKLDMRGIRFMESNSTAPVCFELYKRFNISTLDAKRLINSVVTKRGAIKELVITNFKA
ncbi:MAG: DNA adenine methylase [Succinatimonas hippei]|nr:DNA adenine methylase [Succinatimonas hippei]